MPDELFFVGIRDSLDIRKELLTSSKNLINSLKRYERYRTIKTEKLAHILQLKRIFDELLVLNKKLRNKLPKTTTEPPKVQETKTRPTKITKSHLDILDEELSKIEERLSSLQ